MGSYQKTPFDYGDGSDGAAVLDGVNTYPWALLAGSTYSLLRQVYLTNLQINAGIILQPSGYSLFGTGTLTIAAGGEISADSGGQATNGGANFQGSGGDPAYGPPRHPAGYLCAPDLGDGGTGSGGGYGDPNVGGDGSNNGNTYVQFGIEGGDGGAGGAALNPAGIAGFTDGAPYINFRKLTSQLTCPVSIDDQNPVINTMLTAGIGGGGGGSGGGDGVNNGGGGGGSGGSGGLIAIFFAIINNLGTIHSNGSPGGNGESPPVGDVGGGGGGGGGSGGFIYMVNKIVTAIGTLQVNGGAKGVGGAGQGTGLAGADGNDGGAGLIMKFNSSSGLWS